MTRKKLVARLSRFYAIIPHDTKFLSFVNHAFSTKNDDKEWLKIEMDAILDGSLEEDKYSEIMRDWNKVYKLIRKKYRKMVKI